jgi:hypothetical protein
MKPLATMHDELVAIGERIRRLRQRTLSPSYRRRARKLKSNRRFAKKEVRAAERRVAASLASSRLQPTTSDSLAWLPKELEWLLTSRINIDASALPIWIDDVLDLGVSWLSARTALISGAAWLGPANDVARGCKRFLLTGSITLDSKGRRLTSYSLVLGRKSKRFIAKRQSN